MAVKFIDIKTENEEDKQILDEANKAMKALWDWKVLEDKRYYTNTALERAVRLEFPLIQSIDITHDRINLNTEKYIFTKSRYDRDDKPTEPRFKCDMKTSEMPDTAKEFMEMKKVIGEDKAQIEAAMSLLLTKFNVQEA